MSLPLDQPQARIAFDAVVGLFVLSEVRVRLRSDRNPHGTRLDRRSLQVVKATIVIGAGGAVLLAAKAPGLAIARSGWPLLVAGLVLMCVGMAIRQWAFAVLGRFFTIDVRVQTGQTVVEGGPYRWALLAGLGEPYRRYAEGRPRLVPGLW